MYVALPKVVMNQTENLVALEVAGDGFFSALSSSLPSGEPPPMVNGAVRELFVSSGRLIQSQVCSLSLSIFFEHFALFESRFCSDYL